MNTGTLPKNFLEKLSKVICNPFKLAPLASEASTKKFFHILPQKTELLMVMTDQKEGRGSIEDWVSLHKTLEENHILVPKLLKNFPQEKALLLEDCGDKTLQKIFSDPENRKNLQKAQEKALCILKKTRKINTNSLHLKLDEKELKRDRNLFLEYHIEPRRKFLPSFKETLFTTESLSLEKFLAQANPVFTHRDFHSGNLILKDQDLYLIDFQDACLGPNSYDFVSFIFDPYLPLSLKEREESFHSSLNFFLKDFSSEERNTFLDTLKAQSIQRLYKILGSYNYLSFELKKLQYSVFIKPVVEILYHFDLHDSRWPYLTSLLAKELLNAEEKKQEP